MTNAVKEMLMEKYGITETGTYVSYILGGYEFNEFLRFVCETDVYEEIGFTCMKPKQKDMLCAHLGVAIEGAGITPITQFSNVMIDYLGLSTDPHRNPIRSVWNDFCKLENY